MTTAETICAIAALMAAPAFADDAQICKQFAAITYRGADDGADMNSIIDGIEEALIASQAGSMMETRAVSAAYLSGYSQGLLLIDPADAANTFYAACVSEGV